MPDESTVRADERLASADRTGPASRSDRTILAIHLVSLAIAGIAILWFARHQWFMTDEWDPIARRSIFGSEGPGLLEPHNEHWSTIGILIYRGQVALFGLRTYYPVMVLFVASLLVAAHLLWRFMRRLGADDIVATALAFLFAFLGTMSFDLLFAWNITFSGAVACGFGALLLLPRAGGWKQRDLPIWVLLVLSLAFSGVGITMTIVVAACALVLRGWRDVVRVALVPFAVYMVWLVGWGSSGVNETIVRSGAIGGLPGTIWKGLTSVIDRVTGIDQAGVVVIPALVIFAIVSAWRTREGAVAIVCAAGAALFFGLTSLRRFGLFGDAWIHFPHYAYVAFALMLPLIALAVSKLFRRTPLVLAGLGVIFLALIVQQGIALSDAERDTSAREQAIRARLVAAAELVRNDVPLATPLPAADCCADLDVAHLRTLDHNGKLPDVTLHDVDRTSARTYLQVALAPGAPQGRRVTPSAHAIGDAELRSVASGCAVARGGRDSAVISLDFPARGGVEVASGAGGDLALWFVPRSDASTSDVPPTSDTFGGPAKKGVLLPGQPAALEVATAGRLLIRVPAQTAVRLCTVDVP